MGTDIRQLLPTDVRNALLGSLNPTGANVFLTVSTVSNGLTATASTLKLGGALTANTNITGAFTLSLGTTGSRLANLVGYSTTATTLFAGSSGTPGEYSALYTYGSANNYIAGFQSTDGADITSVESTASTFKVVLTPLNNIIGIDNAGIAVAGNGANNVFVIDDAGASKGIVYAADYSANFTPESLVSSRWVTSNKLSAFAATTSAELAGVISDETGSGLLVFATSPTLTTPILASATSNTAGASGYDGVVFYNTPSVNNPGISPSIHFIRADIAVNLLNQATIQPIFQSPVNGALTLPVGTYRYNALIRVTSMDTTSGNAAFTIAGTATTATHLWTYYGVDSAPTTGPYNLNGGCAITNATAASMQTAGASNSMVTTITGTFEVTVTGTIIPSITLANAAAAIVSAGSYFECWSIGSTSVASIGNWS